MICLKWTELRLYTSCRHGATGCLNSERCKSTGTERPGILWLERYPHEPSGGWELGGLTSECSGLGGSGKILAQ
jgi:hypothetical protein